MCCCREWRSFGAGLVDTAVFVAGAQTCCKERCYCCCCSESCACAECSCSWQVTCSWAGFDSALNRDYVVVADAAYSNTFCTCHAFVPYPQGFCVLAADDAVTSCY